MQSEEVQCSYVLVNLLGDLVEAKEWSLCKQANEERIRSLTKPFYHSNAGSNPRQEQEQFPGRVECRNNEIYATGGDVMDEG